MVKLTGNPEGVYLKKNLYTQQRVTFCFLEKPDVRSVFAYKWSSQFSKVQQQTRRTINGNSF